MFGTRWLTMLFGFAFFSHQVGGFLGVWLGGLAFEATGSYDVVWWLSVFFGVASAVINLPIVEKPVARPVRGRRHNPPAMSAPVSQPGARRSSSCVCGCLIAHDQLRAALDLRVFPDADDGRATAGAATCSRSRSPSRCCCGARGSRSPARSPTASARRPGADRRRAALRRRHRLDGVRARRPLELYLSAGVLIGFGLAGCSFTLIIGAFAKLLPPRVAHHRASAPAPRPARSASSCSRRSRSALIDNVGWQNTLLIFAAILLLMLPLSLRARGAAASAGRGRACDAEPKRRRRRWRKRSATAAMCC